MSIRLHQLERLLAGHGFILSRQKGSHHHYVNARGQRITVSLHGGPHTPVSTGQVAAVQADLKRLTREVSA